MILIGLVGKKRSGKDTFVEAARKHLADKRIQRIAFADALKEEVCIAINAVNARLGTPRRMPITPSYIDENKQQFRLILQGWGTEYRRELCHKDYWIEQFLRKITQSSADIVCVPDVRFCNEAKMITDVGGHLVKIVRPNYNIDGDTHASETELDSIDVHHQIINSDGLAQFQEKVANTLKLIMNKTK